MEVSIINHKTRKALKLSVLEYLILDVIYMNEGSRYAKGWYMDGAEGISKVIGYSPHYISILISMLIKRDLIKLNEKKYMKTKPMWSDLMDSLPPVDNKE